MSSSTAGDAAARNDGPSEPSASSSPPAAPDAAVASTSTACPYLDTVDRSRLDFDFEPSCSVSLRSSPHVYGCLVCGRYFAGRGGGTPAHTHSVETGHAVYVHLRLGTFHCLPDDYEVNDPSLDDIGAALNPTFTAEQIRELDRPTGDGGGGGLLARDLFGGRYLPGYVGLNNLNKTDYVNAVVQALAHVRPLRDFFLASGSSSPPGVAPTAATTLAGRKRKKGRDSRAAAVDPSDFSPLARRFGELLRKMWSDRRFKSNVDPHTFVQAVSVASKKRFHIGKQAEAGEFLAWLLHQLHLGVGGTKKPGSSIVHEVFQGKVSVTTRQRRRKKLPADLDDEEGDDRGGSDDERETARKAAKRAKAREEALKPSIEETTTDSHFLMLTLDIPEKPLFKDDDGGLVIPQEPLVSVLKKFDGVTFSDALSRDGTPQKRRYRLTKLPDHLILHLARFRKNGYSMEKNPTIVPFPVKNLDLSSYVFSKDEKKKKIPTEEEVRAMSVKELKKLLTKHGRSDVASDAIEKSDLLQRTLDFVTKCLPDVLAHKYNLVANVTHDTPAEVGREGRRDPLEEGSYKCHVRHNDGGSRQRWYEMQDLHVAETMAQLIGVSESYILVFEKKGLARW